MGQKCSCLCNKEGESTYKFEEDLDQNKRKQLQDMTEIVNLEYSKAVSKKSQNNNNINNLNQHIREKENNSTSEHLVLDFNDIKLMKCLIILQKLVRGYLVRKQFKKSKKNKIELVNALLNKHEINYRTGNLYKAETVHNSHYDKEGWRKFFSSSEDILKFNLDFGTVFNTKILIYENPEAYYTGSVNIDYKKHGFGKYVTKEGIKYEGFWIRDEFSGWGRYIDQEGSFMQGINLYFINLGYFYKGLLNGKGEKQTLYKISYIGNFVNSIKEGFGAEDTPDHIYQGEFHNDKKEGLGKLTYKNTKDFYEGEFKDNLVNGFGFYTWANSDNYKGDFVAGKMHGKGTYKWPDGGEYVGDYLNNVKEGSGKFKWANGRIYEGPFVNGKPHGIGKLTIDGKTVEVEFVEGKINKNYKKQRKNRNENNEIVNKNLYDISTRTQQTNASPASRPQ